MLEVSCVIKFYIHKTGTKGPWLRSRRGRGGDCQRCKKQGQGGKGILNEKKSIDLTTLPGRLNEKKTGGLSTVGRFGEKKAGWSTVQPQ